MQALAPAFGFTALQVALLDTLFDGMLQMADVQVNASKAALFDAALMARATPGMPFYVESGQFGQAQLERAWSCGREAAGIVGDVQGRFADLMGPRIA